MYFKIAESKFQTHKKLTYSGEELGDAGFLVLRAELYYLQGTKS